MLLCALLTTPFLGALLCLGLSEDRERRRVLVAVPWLHLALAGLWGRFGSPCPPEAWLGLDDLSLLFLLVTDLLFALTSLALPGYLAAHELPPGRNRRWSRETLFSAGTLAFLGTMTLTLASRHMGIFWMAVEATTLASAPLIAYQRSSRSVEAAWKYLLICSVGIAMALIGNIAFAVAAGSHTRAVFDGGSGWKTRSEPTGFSADADIVLNAPAACPAVRRPAPLLPPLAPLPRP